jgi:phospholipase/carboxylesterase
MENVPAPRQAEAEQALHLGPDQASERLVLLHGWGADADDLLDLGELLVGPAVSVVALRAPEPHPYGSGRQWYSLQPIDWSALPAARLALRERLQQLGSSVPLQRTVLLGFSQGGAMAIDVGGGLPLAGIVACSGYPHQGWELQGQLPPVLLSHGRQDPVVPYAASEELQRGLNQAGAEVELLGFNGGHGIDPELLPAVGAFVRRCLTAAA